MSEKEAQAEEEQKIAEIEKAVKEANGLILNDGPSKSLKDDDAWEIETLKSLAGEGIHKSIDMDFLSKAHRVYYSCPIKFDLTQTPNGTPLPDGEKLSREDFPAEGPTPVGVIHAFTQAIRDFEPIFEKIPDKELDTRFEALDSALIKKLLEVAHGDEMRKLHWNTAVWSPLVFDPPELMHSETVERDAERLLEKHIILPNGKIFEQVGLTVRHNLDPNIPSIKPSSILEIRGEPHVQRPKQPEVFDFGRPDREALLICNCKQRGLSRMLMDGEIAYIERSFLKECLLYMLGYKTDVVLLTDFETSILLELNFPDGQETRKRKLDEEGIRTRLKTRLENERNLEFPLRYRVIDIEDTKYTLQAVLASTVYSKLNVEAKQRRKDQVTALDESFAKTEEEFLEADKHDEGLEEDLEEGLDEDLLLAQISRQKRSSYRDINLKGVKFTVLQEGFCYWTQVFRFSNNLVPMVFPWLDGNIQGAVVLKIYDVWRLKTFYEDYGAEMGFCSYDEFCDCAMRQAAVEMECYLRIKEYNDGSGDVKIKSPIMYDYGNMYTRREKDARLGSVLHRGPYLLLSHLEKTDDEVPISTIEEDGVGQLKLLHSIGIKHGDVEPKNYFTTKEGVHFFDFSHARLYPGEVPQRKAESEIEKFKVKLKEQDPDSS